VTTPILPNPPQQPSPVLGADAITPASIQLLQQLQAVGLQQQLLQGEDIVANICTNLNRTLFVQQIGIAIISKTKLFIRNNILK